MHLQNLHVLINGFNLLAMLVGLFLSLVFSLGNLTESLVHFVFSIIKYHYYIFISVAVNFFYERLNVFCLQEIFIGHLFLTFI